MKRLAWLLLLVAASAKAAIIVDEDFELSPSACGITAVAVSENLTFDTSQAHSGRCAAWTAYTFDEDIAKYRYTHSVNSQILHVVYWERYSSTGTWCRHLKRNRFYVGTATNDDSGLESIGFAHPYASGATISKRHSTVCEPPLGDTSCTTDGAGCSCTYVDISETPATDTWIKVEYYAEIKPGCVACDSCTSCASIERMWIDDVLKIDRSTMNIAANSTWKFQNFWLFGNSSNDNPTNDPPFKTVWMDDICVATTAGECGGCAASYPSACGSTPAAGPRRIVGVP